MAALTDEDESKIRYHLGYLASTTAATIQLGLAKPQQTLFVLEEAMRLLTESYAIERVRKILCACDRIEAQMLCAIENLGVAQIESIRMRDNQGDLLEKEYRRWTDRLADILGVPKYAFSTRSRTVGPGASIRVRG